MQQCTVAEMQAGNRFEGFLLVRNADQRTSSNGKKYLDMTLSDKTGDVNAKNWNENALPPEIGSVIKVRSQLQEYNGRLQMKIDLMRPSRDEDNVDLRQLLICAPRTSDDMLQEIYDTIDAMKTEELQKIVREMIRMTGPALEYYPAAQRMHHAERSGLLHHTTSMLRAAKALLPNYPFLNSDLLLSGVIIHDLSKVVEMASDERGNVSDYTTQGLLLGHLVHGVVQIEEAARRCGVTGEYVLLLQHMVISHHEKPEFGSPRPPMFPEAQMLHMIDDMDAKMNEMEGVMRRTVPGAFSEKIWSLDRRLYHPDIPEEELTDGQEQPEEDQADVPTARVQERRIASADAYDGLLGK